MSGSRLVIFMLQGQHGRRRGSAGPGGTPEIRCRDPPGLRIPCGRREVHRIHRVARRRVGVFLWVAAVQRLHPLEFGGLVAAPRDAARALPRRVKLDRNVVEKPEPRDLAHDVAAPALTPHMPAPHMPHMRPTCLRPTCPHRTCPHRTCLRPARTRIFHTWLLRARLPVCSQTAQATASGVGTHGQTACVCVATSVHCGGLRMHTHRPEAMDARQWLPRRAHRMRL